MRWEGHSTGKALEVRSRGRGQRKNGRISWRVEIESAGLAFLGRGDRSCNRAFEVRVDESWAESCLVVILVRAVDRHVVHVQCVR